MEFFITWYQMFVFLFWFMWFILSCVAFAIYRNEDPDEFASYSLVKRIWLLVMCFGFGPLIIIAGVVFVGFWKMLYYVFLESSQKDHLKNVEWV